MESDIPSYGRETTQLFILKSKIFLPRFNIKKTGNSFDDLLIAFCLKCKTL